MAADLALWVTELEPNVAQKLSRVGLIPKPNHGTDAACPDSEQFLRSHLDGQNDLKPATKVVRGQVIRDLQYFGASCRLDEISPGKADNFEQWLVGRGLASTTIHKRLQSARWFFKAMQRHQLIDSNPFNDVKIAATGIQDRQQFVSRKKMTSVIAACPDHHWRTIVALSRLGGLRCPSEVLSLRWQDINWDTGKIVVTSPKTEHIAGKGSRTIPLFCELRPYLADAFELAESGAVYVIDEKYRTAANSDKGWLNANLRTTFERIVRRAGLAPWPRLFHNLRASRETELVELFPIQVVTGWLGNTAKVAMRHYLMTTSRKR